MILKTDYTDAVYSEKKYMITDNGDGTCGIEDRTAYSVDGDYYGAGDINKQNFQCNALNDNYQIVNQIIAKLRTYGITISDYSPPSDIIAAIQSIADTRVAAGRTAGRNAVINAPNSYNLYSTAQYTALTSNETAYKNGIRDAISNLEYCTGWYNDFISYNASYLSDTNSDANTYIKANMTASQARDARSFLKTDIGFQYDQGLSNFLALYKARADNALRNLSF